MVIYHVWVNYKGFHIVPAKQCKELASLCGAFLLTINHIRKTKTNISFICKNSWLNACFIQSDYILLTKQMIKQMTNQNTEIERYNSVPIESTELVKLKRHMSKFVNKALAAKDIGITRNTLTKVLQTGTCNSETLTKIRAKIN